jgi:pimeloyl-ACP methyl ester carboxylesterase
MIITPATDLPKYLFADPEGPVAQQIFGPPADPAQAVDAQIQMVWSMACTGKFVWPLPDKGLKKRIHRLTAPSLIVWGKQDALVPPIYAQEFASRMSDARIEYVDNAGHLPHLEQLEHVSEVITEFLKT